MMQEITLDMLDDLAAGAAILGTGGGGDPQVGKLLASSAIHRSGRAVTVVDVDEVPDDAVIVSLAVMGAPTVITEKMAAGGESEAALTALTAALGQRPAYLACLEAGGVNSMIPIAAAAETGLPLINGDGMGRAFPELQMVLATLAGVAATPMAMTDEHGTRAVLDTIDNPRAETLARTIAVQMGGSAFVALYPMRGRHLRDALVPRTMSLARQRHRDPVTAAAETLHGGVLFRGKIIDIDRRSDGGFDHGVARLHGLDQDTGSRMELAFRNEHLIATRDERVVATVPDLLCVLDTDTGTPLPTETLRYGARVSVIAAPCDPRWHTDDGVARVGPRAFGFDMDPVRVRTGPHTGIAALS